MINIDEDFLKLLYQTTVVFWRTRIISGLRIYPELRKRVIEIFYSPPVLRTIQQNKKFYTISVIIKPENIYNDNVDTHCQYCG